MATATKKVRLVKLTNNTGAVYRTHDGARGLVVAEPGKDFWVTPETAARIDRDHNRVVDGKDQKKFRVHGKLPEVKPAEDVQYVEGDGSEDEAEGD